MCGGKEIKIIAILISEVRYNGTGKLHGKQCIKKTQVIYQLTQCIW